MLGIPWAFETGTGLSQCRDCLLRCGVARSCAGARHQKAIGN